MGEETVAKSENDDLITISRKEYKSLVDAARMLDALEGAGVDNWSGYDEAMEILAEMEDEDS